MSTVAELIDRIFREYLEPAHLQPAFLLVGTAPSPVDTGTTFVYQDNITPPEDLDLVGIGSLLEFDGSQELARATAIDTGTRTVTIQRAQDGTTAASSISVGDRVKIAPQFPRVNVFNAIADAVDDLSPELWVDKTVRWPYRSEVQLAPSDCIRPVRWVDYYGNEFPISLAPGQGISGRTHINMQQVPYGRAGHLTYRAEVARPTAESDDLTEAGVESGWEKVILAKAVAQVLAGGDLTQRFVEYMSGILPEQMHLTSGSSGQDLRNAAFAWAKEVENEARRDHEWRQGVRTIDAPREVWS